MSRPEIQFGPEGRTFNEGDLVQITDIGGADEAKRQLAIVTGSERYGGGSFYSRTILPTRNNSGGAERAEGWTIRKGRRATPISTLDHKPEVGAKVYGALYYEDRTWVVGTVHHLANGYAYIDVDKASRRCGGDGCREVREWLPFDLDGATDGAAAGGEWKTSLTPEEFQPGAVIEVEAKLKRFGNTFSIGCFEVDLDGLAGQTDAYEVTKGNGAKATATLTVVTTTGGYPAVRLVGLEGPIHYRLVNVNAHVDRIRVVKPAPKPKPVGLKYSDFPEDGVYMDADHPTATHFAVRTGGTVWMLRLNTGHGNVLFDKNGRKVSTKFDERKFVAGATLGVLGTRF